MEYETVTLKLPKWALEGFVIIISNKELAAYKEPGPDSPWNVKEERCNRCDECCINEPTNPFGLDDEGRCLKYDSELGCRAGADTPLRCLRDPSKARIIKLGCSITYLED